MAEHVLVVGGTLLDTKGKPTAGLEPGTSNPAIIRSTRGGTARNVAENLARLGAEVILLSAVGDDLVGERLLAQTAESGVNLDYVLTMAGQDTGEYIALLGSDGSLSLAVDDARVMAAITPGHLNRLRSLFRDAQMVMFDGSLTPEALKTAVRLATQYNVPLCADPSSTRLAYKLRPYLSHLHLIVPNEVEAAELCQCDYTGFDPEASQGLARRLVKKGVKTVVLTLSDFGLVYATSAETGYISPSYSEKLDSTGTGDAVTAAIMFSEINQLPTVQAMRLGATAASLTLQSHETVVPDLSLDMLFEHLIV